MCCKPEETKDNEWILEDNGGDIGGCLDGIHNNAGYPCFANYGDGDHFMAGLYRGGGNELYHIEAFKGASAKVHYNPSNAYSTAKWGETKDGGWGGSFDRNNSWSVCPNGMVLTGLN